MNPSVSMAPSAPMAPRSRPLFWPWALIAPLLGLNYLPAFKWMWERWMEEGSYSSHGPLIPLVSAFLIWNDRVRIREAMGPGSAWGLALVGGALFVHLTAGLADVSSVSGFTLVPMLMGFMVLLHGGRFLAAAWFPAAFLVFMVPPPEFVISSLNFTLKLFAADVAEWLLNLTGVGAVRHGSFMLFGEEKVAIGDVCSGLRSLLALASLSVLYAWIIRKRGPWHVAAALAAAVPAAVIGNGVRICVVSYLVLWIGNDKVFKPLIGDWDLHLFTGSLIFIAALGCLVLATAVADRIAPGKAAVSDKEEA